MLARNDSAPCEALAVGHACMMDILGKPVYGMVGGLCVGVRIVSIGHPCGLDHGGGVCVMWYRDFLGWASQANRWRGVILLCLF